jgi:hypothetical protein
MTRFVRDGLGNHGVFNPFQRPFLFAAPEHQQSQTGLNPSRASQILIPQFAPAIF